MPGAADTARRHRIHAATTQVNTESNPLSIIAFLLLLL
jgi:hypothetical protein